MRVNASLLSGVAVVLLAMTMDAATVYDIQFQVNSGEPIPTGSFTYDRASGFSNFKVLWDGITFDMTFSANEPFMEFGGAGCGNVNPSGPAAGFVIMSMAAEGCAEQTYLWTGATSRFIGPQFNFVLNYTGFFPRADPGLAGIEAFPPLPASVDTYATGSWTIIAQSTVPEPATLLIVSGGVIVLLGIKRARMTRTRQAG